jgi:uncharacterized lipoprotein YmbA
MICRRLTRLTLFCLIVIASAACSRSPRVNFYTLDASAKAGNLAPPSGAYGIAVGPVTLPELVDRPQLVISVESNQVDILETHRWAEPLKSQIPRLLADNLGRLLGSDRVTAYPQSAGSDADYRVYLDIRRFEAAKNGVSVDAFWTIRSNTGARAKTGRSQVREPFSGNSYDPLVTAYSRALLAISKDIAAAVRNEALPER